MYYLVGSIYVLGAAILVIPLYFVRRTVYLLGHRILIVIVIHVL